VKVSNAANLQDYFRMIADPANQIVQSPPPFIASMFEQYKSYFAKGATYNPRSQVDPTLAQLFTQGAGSADAGPIWQKMSKYITDQAFTVPLAIQPTPTYAVKGMTGIGVTDKTPYGVVHEWRQGK
jgi:hypothetical protein